MHNVSAVVLSMDEVSESAAGVMNKEPNGRCVLCPVWIMHYILGFMSCKPYFIFLLYFEHFFGCHFKPYYGASLVDTGAAHSR